VQSKYDYPDRHLEKQKNGGCKPTWKGLLPGTYLGDESGSPKIQSYRQKYYNFWGNYLYLIYITRPNTRWSPQKPIDNSPNQILDTCLPTA